jgi:hypothetical protein
MPVRGIHNEKYNISLISNTILNLSEKAKFTIKHSTNLDDNVWHEMWITNPLKFARYR